MPEKIRHYVIVFILYVFLPIIIIIPSSVESGEIGFINKRLKPDFSLFMSIIDLNSTELLYSVETFISGFHWVGMTKNVNKVNERCAKLSGGFIEFSNADCFNTARNSESVFEKSPHEVDNKSTGECTRKENNIIDKIVHGGYFPIITFVIGIIVTALYCAFEIRSRL